MIRNYGPLIDILSHISKLSYYFNVLGVAHFMMYR